MRLISFDDYDRKYLESSVTKYQRWYSWLTADNTKQIEYLRHMEMVQNTTILALEKIRQNDNITIQIAEFLGFPLHIQSEPLLLSQLDNVDNECKYFILQSLLIIQGPHSKDYIYKFLIRPDHYFIPPRGNTTDYWVMRMVRKAELNWIYIE